MQSRIGDLASLFSIGAVFVAIVALILENRRNRLLMQADLLLRLDERFSSVEIKLLRRIAAQKILESEKNNFELEVVFDVLSLISFFYERKAIDADLTYKHFSYWLDRYWLCGEQYVEMSRKYDPLSYATFEKIAKIFIRIEREKGCPVFSEEVLWAFLIEETQIPIADQLWEPAERSTIRRKAVRLARK